MSGSTSYHSQIHDVFHVLNKVGNGHDRYTVVIYYIRCQQSKIETNKGILHVILHKACAGEVIECHKKQLGNIRW